ncbi:MAG: GDSL-type esterase/lipase family protein [Candidatus Promineifilaceae bacterium]
MEASKQDVRICFIGDSFVNGTSDPEFLGWTGRVCAASLTDERHLTHYNLGIRRDTSIDIAARWQSETRSRFPDYSDNRIVFSHGVNDTTLVNGRWRRTMAESTFDTNAMLTQASTRWPVLMVGPLPIDDDEQNERTRQLDAAYAKLCAKINIPYLSVFEPIYQQGTWLREAHANDGAHPFAAGYTELAALVLAWDAWWF